MCHKQKQYNAEMSLLLKKVVVEDKKRIDGIKSILIDYFLAEKAKAMNQVKLIQSSLEYLKGIDKDYDSNNFMNRFSHIQRDDADEKKQQQQQQREEEEEENVFFNFSESETLSMHSKELSALIFSDVVMHGKLYRPGGIIKSNWKPIYANITKFGWFHAFEKREDLRPIVSVSLNNTSVHVKDNEPKAKVFSFEIVVPNSSWFSLTGTPTTYCYKTENAADLVEWIDALKKYAN